MKQEKRNTDPVTRALLSCGLIGCPLFILVFLTEGICRADYNSLRHPVSSLSIGDSGWIQMANFIITGLLLVAFAIGLRRALQHSIGSSRGPLLIGLVATGLIGAGIFTTDPVYGYPQNEPLLLAQYSIRGHLHDLFSILVFIGLPAACLVFRRRFIAAGENGWAVYSSVTAITMILTFVMAGIGFKQVAGFVAVAGILQRLSITIGWIWMALLSLHLMRDPHRSVV